MILIRRAPAYATVQDAGRRGFMSSGVPRCGAMDLSTLSTLNALLGNDDRAAAIEWALSGGEIEFSERTTFALGGAGATATLAGKPVEAFKAVTANTGDVLAIGSIVDTRFLYIAFARGIDVPLVMKSRSTYLPGEFGGHEGRRLKSGDSLPLLPAKQRKRHQVTDRLPGVLLPPSRTSIRFVSRDSAVSLSGEWTISSASDRTGYRLSGAAIPGGASITSEPVCPGVIQLPPGGEPIVLMSDAPTIGGYRIIGTVISSDLGALAQLVPGSTFSFSPTSVDAAQREALAEASRLEQIREWGLS